MRLGFLSKWKNKTLDHSDSQVEEVERRLASPQEILTVEQTRNHFSIKGA